MPAADPDEGTTDEDSDAGGVSHSRIGGYAYPDEGSAPEPREPEPSGTDRLLGGTAVLVVELLVGALVAVIATVVALSVTGSAFGFMIGVLVWFGVTVKLVRKESVPGTLQLAAYALAVALASVPLVAFGPGAGDGGRSLAVRLA
ncbi:MAG: hypothetical protein ABEH35_06140, partial [Haloarculaceae archaeon]